MSKSYCISGAGDSPDRSPVKTGRSPRVGLAPLRPGSRRIRAGRRRRSRHARARGQQARAVLKGAGIASDAFHITSPDPEGAGQGSAITKALRQAGLQSGDVTHVNCHATGTAIGDLAEATSIRQALGSAPVLTAPKASLGHLVGAAGAVEAVITILSIQKGLIPPTLNLENVSDGIEFDIVTGTARSGPVDAAISNSFGFGGQNVSLLFTRA